VRSVSEQKTCKTENRKPAPLIRALLEVAHYKFIYVCMYVCNICETVRDRTRLLWRTNRKSHTRFRLVPKSMTLD